MTRDVHTQAFIELIVASWFEYFVVRLFKRPQNEAPVSAAQMQIGRCVGSQVSAEILLDSSYITIIWLVTPNGVQCAPVSNKREEETNDPRQCRSSAIF